eukprot:TRINITY_DN43521_c0_g1_i1.p1 TRINITY_DN43521_c0_g1~~TRINITY_DN43521_c0_g1_i1.p1  ORF type:complete len:438 (+),score=98.63 TRINITY_DN43521_c0_g1_i1:37-1314(+)
MLGGRLVAVCRRRSLVVRLRFQRRHSQYEPRGRQAGYRSGEVLSGATKEFTTSGSRHYDKTAPKDPEERKEWLKQQLKGYTPATTDPKAFDRAMKIYQLAEFDEKNPDKEMTLQDMQERAWLAKRKKQLDAMGSTVMIGVGLAVTLFFANSIYNLLTAARPEHPAFGVEIGAACELVLALNGKKFKDPVVIGLFTERAPHASENFHRLVKGSDDGTLAGSEIFRIDGRSGLYGGSVAGSGNDSRGGVVVTPLPEGAPKMNPQLRRLPQEDSDLPPFKWAVVSCNRAFQRNAGFNSIFGILATDNPASIGASQSLDAQQYGEQQVRSTITKIIFGKSAAPVRQDLDPEFDGAYVFGTVLSGQHVLQYLLTEAAGKPPMYRPAERSGPATVTVSSCRTMTLDNPAKKKLLAAREADDVELDFEDDLK